MPTCVRLTVAELNDLVADGWTVHAGPYASQSDCETACTAVEDTGTGTDVAGTGSIGNSNLWWDTFTGEELLSAHTPDIPVGGAYSNVEPGFACSGGRLVCHTDAEVTFDPGETSTITTIDFQFDATVAEMDGKTVIFRVGVRKSGGTSSTDCVQAWIDVSYSGSTQVASANVACVPTSQSSSGSFSFALGARYTMEITNSSSAVQLAIYAPGGALVISKSVTTTYGNTRTRQQLMARNTLADSSKFWVDDLLVVPN